MGKKFVHFGPDCDMIRNEVIFMEPKEQNKPPEEELPVEEQPAEELPYEREEDRQSTYEPRPLGFRIFALVLAILVVIGLILYYFNIFTAGT